MRKLIWGKGVLDPVQTELDPVEFPHRSQICAAIVTFNIGEALHRCVDAIQNQVGHVLIVENGSGEPTRRELSRLTAPDSVTVILNEHNEGIARAFNQAVEWARGGGFQWILLLDHDSEATPGMVEELVRGYETLDRAGIRNVGILAASPFDRNIQRYLYCPPRANGGLPLQGGEVISAGSLIRLGVFDVVGPFNEDLFIYFVDVDFYKRLVRAGFGAYICPEAVFLHQEGLKKRHRFLWIDAWYDHYGKEARYYLTRNTIYVITKLPVSRGDIRVLIHRLWTDHVNILLFDKERFGVLWFSFRGLIDGLRGKVGPMNSVSKTGSIG
ncbi:MAG: glycosyltransferase [Terracidiphilus sp.]|jgi:rhamnosyltransferase